MIKRLACFLFVALILWAGATGLAWGLKDRVQFPDSAVISVAAGLCLLPSLVTLAWASWSTRQTPEQQLVATLGGTAVRMFIVLAVGLLLTSVVPYFTEQQQGFWISTLFFYLLYLGLEVVVLLLGRTTPEQQSAQRTS